MTSVECRGPKFRGPRALGFQALGFRVSGLGVRGPSRGRPEAVGFRQPRGRGRSTPEALNQDGLLGLKVPIRNPIKGLLRDL